MSRITYISAIIAFVALFQLIAADSYAAALTSGADKQRFFSLDGVRHKAGGKKFHSAPERKNKERFFALNRQVDTISRVHKANGDDRAVEEQMAKSAEGEETLAEESVLASLLPVKRPELPKSSFAKPVNGISHQWPVDAAANQWVSSQFGMRTHPVTHKKAFHAGVDIAADTGTKVMASADGKVTGVGTHPRLGRYVKVEHADGSYSLYGHLSRWNVKEGARVAGGQKIGEVGSTGRSTGAHLDYSLRVNGEPVDPLGVLEIPAKLKTVEISFAN